MKQDISKLRNMRTFLNGFDSKRVLTWICLLTRPMLRYGSEQSAIGVIGCFPASSRIGKLVGKFYASSWVTQLLNITLKHKEDAV